MNDKFKNLPVDNETRIISRKNTTLGEYDVLYEVWTWDGICAESIIFVTTDVSGFSNAELEQLVRTSGLVKKDSDITFGCPSEGFTLVNFNFEID
ncbi:MAG: hypothetical protein IMF09_08575 [Proteobacteria bacterium]|nr:hypothetical protein [Pseudomonadota bacterium]